MLGDFIGAKHGSEGAQSMEIFVSYRFSLVHGGAGREEDGRSFACRRRLVSCRNQRLIFLILSCAIMGD